MVSIPLPPTQADLPSEDGEPMETERHKAQMELLIEGLHTWLADREDGYVGGNMFVYFSLAQVRNQDFKGPDIFVVLGVPKGERRSWVCWEEGKTPDVIIELLSESTAAQDKGEKKQLYQNQLHIPEYYWFDPFHPDDWAGFHLQAGGYQEISASDQGYMISPVLGLVLLRWQGLYKGIHTTWLRWATVDGDVLPTEAEQQRRRAEQAESQIRIIVRNLQEKGMDLEEIMAITHLPRQQVENFL